MVGYGDKEILDFVGKKFKIVITIRIQKNKIKLDNPPSAPPEY